MSDVPHTPPPSIGQIFAGFFGIGVIGFGGVLPLTRRMIVEQRRWMTGAEFADILALCQFLPGGNVINLSAAVGLRFRGLPGAVAGLLGLMAAPFVIVILLGLFYARFQDDPLVRRGFVGLAAAAAGLVITMAIKIAAPLRRDLPAAAIALLCCVAIAWLRTPMLSTLLVIAPIGIGLHWWRAR